jgi:hypothetical protein
MADKTILARDLAESLRLALIAEADAAHVQYPQYRGHWDGWVLVRFKRNVTTKMGRAFDKGEIALAKPASRKIGEGRFAGRQAITAYSTKTKCDTSALATEAVFL